MSDIQSIVIVGGGTTGWLAACFLQRALDASRQAPLPITLVEAPQIAAIGVGEATLPTLRGMLQALGLPESELLKATDATLNNGLRFHGWRTGSHAGDDVYDHPFEAPPPFSGFATTAHAFRDFLRHDGLADRINARLATLDTDDVRALAAAGAEIRAMVEAQPFPADLEAAIREAFATLSAGNPQASFAVRSSATAEDLQNEVYEIGKRHPFADLKAWFKALYEVLLGQDQGPRMGSFIALYGRKETADLIRKVLNGESLSAA